MNSTDTTQNAPGRSRYEVRNSTDTTRKAPGRSMRRGSLRSSVSRFAPFLRSLSRESEALAEFRSLRSRNRRRDAVERPAPFSPARFAGPRSVVGGPAGSATTYLRPSARPLDAERLGSRQPSRQVHERSSAVAREKRARERRALVRAARLGRAEAVPCGAGRCNRATVACSSVGVASIS
jgi:hypothetical protein